MGVVLVTGYPHWLVILIFLLLWRGLQDYLNSPLLMGRGMKLHPFAVILGVMIFGEVGGMPAIFPVGANHGKPKNHLEALAPARDRIETEATSIADRSPVETSAGFQPETVVPLRQ